MPKIKKTSELLQQGFTLIELLVISPIIIIAVAGTLALLINLVTENVVANQENAMTSEVQNALNNIEKSLSSADKFLGIGSGPDNLPDAAQSSSYQDGAPSYPSGVFNGMFIIGNTYDQVSNGSSIVPAFRDAPEACGSAGMSGNPIARTNTVYFAQRSESSKTDLKRRVLTEETRNICGSSIFLDSCKAKDLNSNCTKDDILATDVVLFDVTYFKNNAVTADKSEADAASVRLVLKRSIAGKAVVSEGERYFALLNRQ